MDDTRFDLDRIHTAQDTRELAARYDQMADSYDDSLQDEWGWTSPEFTADILAKYVTKSSKILDAGAGTGLVGEALVERGFRDLIGIDMSEKMFAKAREKKVYRAIYGMELGKTLTFSTDFFDAVISVGVMAMGHAPAHSLDELVRITRPAGHLVYTLRPFVYENKGFKEKHRALEAQGRWKLLERTQPFVPMPKKEPDFYYETWVFQVIE